MLRGEGGNGEFFFGRVGDEERVDEHGLGGRVSFYSCSWGREMGVKRKIPWSIGALLAMSESMGGYNHHGAGLRCLQKCSRSWRWCWRRSGHKMFARSEKVSGADCLSRCRGM